MTTLQLTLDDVRAMVSGWTFEQVKAFALKMEEEEPELYPLLQQVVGSMTPPSAPGPLVQYVDQPSAFARDLVDWPDGKALTSYQGDALDGIPEHGRLCVRGPHTMGKTGLASLAFWWFALTRDALGVDWKIPTTASVFLQLNAFLWPEIHKWYRLLRWDVMERDPVVLGKELMLRHLRLRTGEAFAASPADAAKIEGAHADEIFYIFDEAKTIPDGIWDATEGAFAGGGEDVGGRAYALAISTPGEPQGRFYDIQKQKPGTEDWHPMRVTKEMAIAAKRMSRYWAEQRARQWGEKSAVYLNRVEGEFASGDEDGVIPLSWVEAAMDRWKERWGEHGEQWEAPGPLEVIGVDCSGAGKDKTVLAHRHGDVVAPLDRPRKRSTETGDEEMATAGRIVGLLRAHPNVKAIIDAGGLGSPIVGRVREQVERRRAVAFIAGAGTERKDKQGIMGFANVRSAAWWHMRELLDPEEGSEICLPPDDNLIGDLTAPHWKEMSKGVIAVEPKDKIKLRLHRSTDDGDAVVQAFWGPLKVRVRGSGATQRAVRASTGVGSRR